MILGVTPMGCTWSLMRQGERVANPAELQVADSEPGAHAMALLTSPADHSQCLSLSSVELLEQQLLALGPLPRRGEHRWDAAQWARYADIVRALVVELSCPTPDQPDSAHDA
jgi:hypothetical protein